MNQLHARLCTRYVQHVTPCQLWRYELRQCRKEEPEPPKQEQIIGIISQQYDFTLEQLRSSCRDKRLVHARHLAMWLLLVHCRMSLSEVARTLNRDHTTIISARDKVNSYIVNYPNYREELTQLENKIKYKL